MNRSRLFVISSPSGGGKTTLVKKLLSENDMLVYSISVTTRKPRTGERDGIDYIFMDDSEFQKYVREDAFLEWAEVHNHFYGTLKISVQKMLDQKRSVVLDIDVQGGLEIKKKRPESVLIFIMPPSVQTLKERLVARGTDEKDTIDRRLNAAKHEMKIADLYDYIIFNHQIDKAYAELLSIIQSEINQKM